jgi:hypothetical protein
MGTKGQCDLAKCRIQGATNWQFRGPQDNPYQAEQAALIHSVRRGEPINHGAYMAGSTMVTVLGQIACYTGTATKWDDVAESDVRYGPLPEESNFDTPPPTRPDATGNYPLPTPGTTKIG